MLQELLTGKVSMVSHQQSQLLFVPYNKPPDTEKDQENGNNGDIEEANNTGRK